MHAPAAGIVLATNERGLSEQMALSRQRARSSARED